MRSRFPSIPERLPTVLSQEEVARLIDASGNLMHRAMVMTLYATGVRRAELCRLKVADIDSERMVLHIHARQGWTRPRCSVKPEAARHTARVLALDEAEDLPVSGHGEQLAGRRARHHEGRLDCCDRSGEGAPASPSVSRRTRSGTVTRRTCLKRVPISAPSRCCSDTPSWPTRRSICICRAGICKLFPARLSRSPSRLRPRPGFQGGVRSDEPAHP